jgi:hypothetical protein
MLACGLLALAGLFAITVWGDLGIVAPTPHATDGRVAAAVQRYLWWADLVIAAGLTAGVLAAGAGGRLVMRLLAVTSPDARGALTEADETVGRITLGGTIGFVVFGALPLAMVGAIGFAIIYRWLPRGRLTGLLFGLLLVVFGATRLEPLRSNNPDFRLLGPGWLAATAFGLVVLGDGMLTAAVMGWYSRRLPLPVWRGTARGHYLLLVALLLVFFVIGVPVLLLTAVGAGVVGVAARIAPSIANWWTSSRTTMVGRVLLAGGSLLALPGFVITINDIIP